MKKESIWKKDMEIPQFEPLRGDWKADVLVIGGGMAAGLAVAAAPAVILGILGAAIGAASEEEKLREAKELVYQNALKKQTAILEALVFETETDKKRIEYLNGLNNLLSAAIKDLEHDLGVA